MKLLSNKKIVVLGGAGKMGLALIDGLVASELVKPEAITATARHEKSLAAARERGVETTLDNRASTKGADIVVVAVHPDGAEAVMQQIKPELEPDQLLISIVTGVRTSHFEQLAGIEIPVIRANPNIASVVGQSATVICSGAFVGETHVETARALFGTVGLVEELAERHMNASTGLGGCGPAFVFKIIEGLSEGGVKAGLPRDVSRNIAAQVIKGAAEMVLASGKHPAELKDEVTTPGGCTIDGIAKLQERGIAIALIDAVEVASSKAGTLFDKI